MRYYSIDLLRTVAICVMVIVHFCENLAGYTPPITGLGAPLFAFLSGMSYRLWVQGQQARGRSEQTISKVSIRRGLFVFGVGLAFNVLVWTPEDVFNWDVLTFIGSALLVLNLLRHQSLAIPLLLAGLSLAIAPVLRHEAEYISFWENGYYDYDFTFPDVMMGYLATGYFPFFPWISYSLIGWVCSAVVFAPQTESPPSLKPVVLGGCGLLGLALLLEWLHPAATSLPATIYLQGWQMFPPTTEYVCGSLGIALLLFSLLHWRIDRAEKLADRFGLLRTAQAASRYTFSIYILHHLVHVWPLYVIALAQGLEISTYWQNALPVDWALGLSFLFLVCMFALLRRFGAERIWGMEACMRWLCDEN
jgi:hypothetical protein